MANRTFKIEGYAYTSSGNCSLVISVDGNEVFNGDVTTTATPRSGDPSTVTAYDLCTFTMDESVTGDKSLSITASGGEVIIGKFKCNGAYKGIDFHSLDQSVLADQQTVATTLGETALNAQQSGLYAKLNGGTADWDTDGADIQAVNDASGALNTTDYVYLIATNDKKASAQINGEAVTGMTDNDQASAEWWPILQDGDTLTATWSITPYDNWPRYAVS